MFRILRLVFPLVILISCEKNIDFKLNDAQEKLVVNGSIENGFPPRIILNKSFSYYNNIDVATLLQSFVHDADVYVSNGILTHKLKEQSFQPFPGIDFYYYGIDSADLSTAFVGEINKTYQLRIVAEGKEFLSAAVIPAFGRPIDSLYAKPLPQDPDTTKRLLMLKTSDPPGLGNYVRYFTQKNSEPFYPGLNSVFDDQFIDGTTYTIPVEPGVDRNNIDDIQNNFFHAGDTVTLKLCSIDRPSYLFWNTWEFSQQSIGNPFAQPNKVIGNISNGALGAFCGYGAVYRTIILQ
jgi:hypothetical protein